MIRQVLPRIMCLHDEYRCTCWHYVTNHLIISNDKDFNVENRKDIHIHDSSRTHRISSCVCSSVKVSMYSCPPMLFTGAWPQTSECMRPPYLVTHGVELSFRNDFSVAFDLAHGLQSVAGALASTSLTPLTILHHTASQHASTPRCPSRR
jgi:hypothetical protein